MRVYQPIPPPTENRPWIRLAWTHHGPPPVLGEQNFRAVVAVGEGHELTVYLSSRIDTSHAPMYDTSRYVIIGSAGTNPVTNVAVSQSHDTLTLTTANEVAPSTLTIQEATLQGVGGTLLPEQALSVIVAGSGGSPLPPPEIVNITPPPNTVISEDQPVSFTVAGQVDLLSVTVYFAHTRRREAVYGSSYGFSLGYTKSFITELGQDTYRFTIQRTGGWPKDSYPTFTVDVA